MWIALLLFAAALFAGAGLISPLVWFFVPAVALLAMAIALATGIISVAQDRPDRDPEPDETGAGGTDTRAKGYAHPGQAPGHSA